MSSSSSLVPLISFKEVSLGFGGSSILYNMNFHIFPSDMICLVGNNGCGKSTLLKLLSGEIEPDSGKMFFKPNISVVRLEQNMPPSTSDSVYDYIFSELKKHKKSENVIEEIGYKVEALCDELDIHKDAIMSSLSGGEARKVLLALTLSQDSDLLLLDEPTNHLDIETILWLEKKIKSYKGAIVCISHDKAFLDAISKKVYWINQGTLRCANIKYSDFNTWQQRVYEEEEKRLSRLNIQINDEIRYMQRGVTARRKRNMGRVDKLSSLIKVRASFIRKMKKINFKLDDEFKVTGKDVIKVRGISKSYSQQNGSILNLVENFSTIVKRGDKIAIVGKNGVGKTTLLNLLIGKITPDSGTVKLGTNLIISSFEQRREHMNEEDTLMQYMTNHSGEYIEVNGKLRHVIGYLKDFLFKPQKVLEPIKNLSGGERNRLILAKLLASPTNFIVLDEPTNDLDMDTIDLLVEILSEYKGTMIFISHDRDFIDKIANSTIYMDENANAVEYAGGYTDLIQQIKLDNSDDATKVKYKHKRKVKNKSDDKLNKYKNRLSYNDEYNLKILPATIDRMTKEIMEIEQILADAELYVKNPERFDELSYLLIEKRNYLNSLEEQWLDVAIKQEKLASE